MLTATGLAWASTYNCMGGELVMRGNVWFSQQLKAELLYSARIHSFNLGIFSSVAPSGSCDGGVGGSVLVGHEQGLPSIAWWGLSGSARLHLFKLGWVESLPSKVPITGKVGLMMPRSL